jgi:hypothetical protein
MVFPSLSSPNLGTSVYHHSSVINISCLDSETIPELWS